MRLVTFVSADGAARLGAVVGDRVIDLAAASGGRLPADMLGLVEAGPAALEIARDVARQGGEGVALSTVRLLAPIPRPRRNVFCLGMNYRDHAAELAEAAGTPLELPKFAVFFTKPPTSVVGPDAAVEYNPTVTQQVDWEVEFTVVIGRGGRDIPAASALDHVFGYTIANDVSARDLQFRHGGQFFKGKALDTFAPIGPWIVTPDEIGDPANLAVRLTVNGVEKQRSNTRELIFDVSTTIAALSEGLTLEPGDIILTGTPGGVGFARSPQEFLKDGDVVECEVEGVGVLRNQIVSRGSA